jgi:quercetin dioxygenase-like cupin family protein
MSTANITKILGSACIVMAAAGGTPGHAQTEQNQSTADVATGRVIMAPESAQYSTVPVAPSCNALVGTRGDPRNEAATFLGRLTNGCVVPWHWHHATEEVLLIKGTAVAQMWGRDPITVKAGAYLQLPAHHVHRFRCASAAPCYMFVVADAAFDINYVADSGTAITPEAAIASVRNNQHPGW